MPHNMKKFVLLLTLAVFCLTGCMDWTSSYQPSITVTTFVTSSGDTLYGHVDDHDVYTLDTLFLGDTAFFCIYNQSYANNLVTSYMTWDTTVVKCWTTLSEEFNAILKPTSRVEDLYFDYETGYNQTFIPVFVLPLKAGRTKLDFYVTSDAQKYGENSGEIEMIVAERK